MHFFISKQKSICRIKISTFQNLIPDLRCMAVLNFFVKWDPRGNPLCSFFQMKNMSSECVHKWAIDLLDIQLHYE